MYRQLRALTLLAILLWQSIAMLGTWSVSQQVDRVEHLIVHAQDTNHHHHENKALHMDDDGGPVQHVHADTSASATLLIGSPKSLLTDISLMPPPVMSEIKWLSATLDSPLRPPIQRVQ